MRTTGVGYVDSMSMQNLMGGGTTTSTGNSEESVRIPVGKTYSDRQIWQAVQSAERHKMYQGGCEDSQTLWASERLTTALTHDYGKAIDNQRIQLMMGILTTHGKATAETIPDIPDRSMFSCVKYQFFLDAPFEIANHCCGVMKKNPGRLYTKQTGRRPITAQMASESRLRTQVWLRQGCNAFDAKKPVSNPMAFWTEQDVLLYIWLNKTPIASVYGDVVIDYAADGQLEGQMSFRDLGGDWELFDTDRPTLTTTGCKRTGCVFCGFGCHLEKPGEGRFEKLKITHPKLYDYVMKPWSEGGLGYKEVIDWINEHGNMHIRY